MKKMISLMALCIFIIQGVDARKIYRVQYESQAGWRNPEKQHLLL